MSDIFDKINAIPLDEGDIVFNAVKKKKKKKKPKQSRLLRLTKGPSRPSQAFCSGDNTIRFYISIFTFTVSD